MRWLIALVLMALPAMAEDIVLGLSQDEVAITTSFDGKEILIFGAIKREAPPPPGELGVLVAISGPPEQVSVRRKDKRFGIWVNTDEVLLETTPSFYAVATSGPLNEVLGVQDNLAYKVSVQSMLSAIRAPSTILDADAFVEALMRIRQKTGAYQVLEGQVVVDQATLFRTRVQLPAALTEGDYATRIFLTRDGSVVSTYETKIDVRKVGLERWLYKISREQPFWYGILALTIAIAAGWGASAAFSLLRN